MAKLTDSWNDRASAAPAIVRTDRDYVHDLCDAYNRNMAPEAVQRGLEWYVTRNGELKLGQSLEADREVTRQIEGRRRTETARALRRQHEQSQRGAEQ